ncbi:unnamed protein product [Darwinula stevensoni]|uniref:Uncharacterized protein n=1 Tax=Darwinula stevensoni TaxID=69355 RepID=A0A7R8WZN2_9CRUS|nr:unnamed protein product [Darwinula stevensoni]CAG0880764.1 unnamed protein product [Darwinula stevensoni]
MKAEPLLFLAVIFLALGLLADSRTLKRNKRIKQNEVGEDQAEGGGGSGGGVGVGVGVEGEEATEEEDHDAGMVDGDILDAYEESQSETDGKGEKMKKLTPNYVPYDEDMAGIEEPIALPLQTRPWTNAIEELYRRRRSPGKKAHGAMEVMRRKRGRGPSRWKRSYYNSYPRVDYDTLQALWEDPRFRDIMDMWEEEALQVPPHYLDYEVDTFPTGEGVAENYLSEGVKGLEYPYYQFEDEKLSPSHAEKRKSVFRERDRMLHPRRPHKRLQDGEEDVYFLAKLLSSQPEINPQVPLVRRPIL